MDQDNSYHTPYNVDIATLVDETARVKYIERVLSLPKPLVDILFNSETANWIEEELGPRFNLSADQKRELTRTIRDVVLAEFNIKTISEIIQNRLQVDEVTAKNLTKELVANVLMPGWEDLKKIHDAKFKNELPPSPPPPPPAINPNNVLDLSKKP